MSHAYIFYGKAGSGKGTQAHKLKEYLESQGRTVIYIETGEMFRKFMAPNATLAEQLTTTLMNSGNLMPVFFPIYMWSEALIKQYTGNEDIIFDGVARRMDEGEALDSALGFFNIASRFIFYINITDQTAITRIEARHQGRAEDMDLSKVQTRLDWYRENVVPVMEHFKKDANYKFSEINGEEDVDGVFEQIKNTL